jgi:hypothetical protein
MTNRKHTSTSAILTIGIGSSSFPPGVKGIPRCANTALFGAGNKEQVMNLMALISVFAAM